MADNIQYATESAIYALIETRCARCFHYAQNKTGNIPCSLFLSVGVPRKDLKQPEPRLCASSDGEVVTCLSYIRSPVDEYLERKRGNA